MSYDNFDSSMYFTCNHVLGDEFESGDYYYTPLDPNQIRSRNYTSIRMNSSVHEKSNDSSSICSETSSINENMNKNKSTTANSDYEVFYIKFSNYVENIETSVFRKFNDFLKTKESKFISFDQAIEKVFDQVNFETRLEDLIKNYAYANCTKTPTNTNNKNENNQNDYYLLKKDQNGKLKRTPDILFLEHALILLNFSKLDKIIESYQDLFDAFLDKLISLTEAKLNSSIINTANLFISLFNKDWDGIVNNYELLSFNSRLNVLKNLIYFSFKFALFHMIDLGEKSTKSSVALILNSIYQYVKHINCI